jgi:hypothetical protein
MYTREELSQKTIEELNEIIRDFDLPWYRSESKDAQITRILSNQNEDEPLFENEDFDEEENE